MLKWRPGHAEPHQVPVRNLLAGANHGEILRTLLDERSDRTKCSFVQRSDKLVGSQLGRNIVV